MNNIKTKKIKNKTSNKNNAVQFEEIDIVEEDNNVKKKNKGTECNIQSKTKSHKSNKQKSNDLGKHKRHSSSSDLENSIKIFKKTKITEDKNFSNSEAKSDEDGQKKMHLNETKHEKDIQENEQTIDNVKYNDEYYQSNDYENVATTSNGSIHEKYSEDFVYHLIADKSAIIRCSVDKVFYFNGVMSVKVIHGAVKINGYTVTNKEANNIKVYSLNAYNYFPIHVLPNTKNKLKTKRITQILTELNVSENIIKSIVEKMEPRECLLYVQNAESSAESHWGDDSRVRFNDKIMFNMIFKLAISIPYLLPNKNYFKYSDVSPIEKHLSIQFFDSVTRTSRAPILIEAKKWDELFLSFVNFEKPVRAVLCGSSGVGKTTLLKYLVNRSIQQWGKALVLDFDPGQAEFNLPGTLSAVVIDKPIFGPNFTHILPTEKCYFYGDIKCHSSADLYIQFVDDILKHCNSKQKFNSIPWFINTMGYAKDDGILLNCRIIHDVQPSHVIQIQSKKASENFPSILTEDYVQSNLWMNKSLPHSNNLEYDTVVIDSVKNKPYENMNKILKTADKRKNVLLAYFSQMFNSIEKDYTVNRLTPYGCNIRTLQVDTFKSGELSRGEVLTAMNGELVALCTGNNRNENLPLATLPCLGYGIVYCIDQVTKELFLLTPLPLSKMIKVKTLILGSPTISIPRKFLDARCKELYNKKLPYTATGGGHVTSQANVRTYRQQPPKHGKKTMTNHYNP